MKIKAKIIQSIKIWVVIYPSITLFYALFASHLSAMPLFLRTLILTLILVPWMVFVGLPVVHIITRIFTSDR
ncbi:hypothetical protein SAMN04488505_102574 [Chitinophaga rupis]|uniref:Uncharacterized protein n=1 Tax=Chitinophaga rupis TaxID=573321 RepID=A0A1H7RAN9_9BACT|nr:hypothetical protein SAMN04488505_102574 [Chitinophaga rupis]